MNSPTGAHRHEWLCSRKRQVDCIHYYHPERKDRLYKKFSKEGVRQALENGNGSPEKCQSGPLLSNCVCKVRVLGSGPTPSFSSSVSTHVW
jgi:hypothetical protein